MALTVESLVLGENPAAWSKFTPRVAPMPKERTMKMLQNEAVAVKQKKEAGPNQGSKIP